MSQDFLDSQYDENGYELKAVISLYSAVQLHVGAPAVKYMCTVVDLYGLRTGYVPNLDAFASTLHVQKCPQYNNSQHFKKFEFVFEEEKSLFTTLNPKRNCFTLDNKYSVYYVTNFKRL